MSRRKQAKPRALKREEWEEGEEEEEEESEEREIGEEEGVTLTSSTVATSETYTNGLAEEEEGKRPRATHHHHHHPSMEVEGEQSSSTSTNKEHHHHGGSKRTHHHLSNTSERHSNTGNKVASNSDSPHHHNSLLSNTLPLSQLPDLRKPRDRSDDEESEGSLDSEVSVGGSSWDVGSDGRGSLSPASSATPTSASETDVEAAATVGVTQTTPYQCSFCDRAFPRLSYLKRHEQLHGLNTRENLSPDPACCALHVPSPATAASSPCLLAVSQQYGVSVKVMPTRDMAGFGTECEYGNQTSEKYCVYDDGVIEESDSVREVAVDESLKCTETCDDAYNTYIKCSGELYDVMCAGNDRNELHMGLMENNSVSPKLQNYNRAELAVTNFEVKKNKIVKKGDLDGVAIESVPLFDIGSVDLNSDQCQGKMKTWFGRSPTILRRPSEDDSDGPLEKNLKQTQLQPLDTKSVWKVSETEVGSSDNGYAGSGSSTWKINCSFRNEESSKVSCSDIQTPDGMNVETTQENKLLKSQRKPSVEACTNVWMQDNVFTYVEKELKKMEVCHKPLQKNSPVFEEVFHFIEMELRKLDSRVCPGRSPSALTKAFDYDDIFKTPKYKCSVIHTSSNQEKSCLASNCDSVAEDCKVGHYSSDVESGGSESLKSINGLYSPTCDNLLAGQNVSKVFEKPVKGSDTVLCLRHLDQLPADMYSSTSLMKPHTSKQFSVSLPPSQETSVMDDNTDCKIQAFQVIKGCASNISLEAKDEEAIEGNLYSGDILVNPGRVLRRRLRKSNLSQNKDMDEDKDLKWKRVQKKINRKMKLKKSNTVISKKANKTKQLRNDLCCSRKPHSQFNLKKNRLDEVIDQVTYDNVWIGSRNITKLDFPQKPSESQFTGNTIHEENLNLISAASKYSVLPQSSSSPHLPSIPDALQYSQRASNVPQLNCSRKRCSDPDMWERPLLKESSSDKIENMRTSQYDGEHFNSSMQHMNFHKCKFPHPLPMYTSLSLLSSPKVNLFSKASSSKTETGSKCLARVPWQQHMLSCDIPSPAKNPIHSTTAPLHANVSPRLFSSSDSGRYLDYVVSESYNSYENKGNECLTSNVVGECDKKEELESITEINNYASEGVTTGRQMEINNGMIKIRPCGVPEIFKDVQTSEAIDLQTGATVGHSEKSQVLYSNLNAVHLEQERLVPGVIQLHTCENVYDTNICKQEFAVENIEVLECNNSSNVLKETTLSVPLSKKYKCMESPFRQDGCRHELPSFFSDPVDGSKLGEEVVNVCCQEEDPKTHDYISLKFPKNHIGDQMESEQETQVTEYKFFGGLLANNCDSLPCVNVEPGDSNEKFASGAGEVKSLSTVVVKDVSNWKIQKYHPYILPKKRRKGMFRVPRRQRVSNDTHINKSRSVHQVGIYAPKDAVLDTNEKPLSLSGLNLLVQEKISTIPQSEVNNFQDIEVKRETFPVLQIPEDDVLVDIASSETYKDQKIEFRSWNKGGTNSEDEDRNNNRRGQKVIGEVNKPSASELTTAKRKATVENLLASTRPRVQTLSRNSSFTPPPINLKSIPDETRLSDLLPSENSESFDAFQNKVITGLAKPFSLQKIPETENILKPETAGENMLPCSEVLCSQSDEQKPDTLQSFKTTWSGSSSSLPDLRTMSPSSIVRRGAHFKLIHKIAPCILRPNRFKALPQNDSSTSQPVTDKRPQGRCLNRISSSDDHKLDFDATILSNSGCLSCKDFSISHSINDISYDEDVKVSLNFSDTSLSTSDTVDINVDIDPLEVNEKQSTGDSDLIQGKRTSSVNNADKSSIASSSVPVVPQIFNSRNDLPASSASNPFIITLVSDKGSNKRAENDSTNYSPKIRNRLTNRTSENIPDIATFENFKKAEKIGGTSLEAENTYNPFFETTNWSSFPFTTNGKDADFAKEFSDMNVSRDTVKNSNSIHFLLPEESILDTHKHTSLTFSELSSQDHLDVAKPVVGTNFSKHSSDSEEYESNLNKIEKLCILEYSEQSSCKSYLLNNSISGTKSCLAENNFCSSDERKGRSKTMKDSFHVSENSHCDSGTKSMKCRASTKLNKSSQRKKIKNLAFTKYSEEEEEEDILDLAVRADLYDVVTLGNVSEYSWPQIEEANVPAPLINQYSEDSSDQASRTNTVRLRAQRKLNFADDNRFSSREPNKGTPIQSNRFGPIGGAMDVPTLSIADDYPDSIERFFILKDSTLVEVFNIPDDAKINTPTEDETSELKDYDSGPNDDEKKTSSPDLIWPLTHADQLPFRCEFCGRLFKHKRSRDRHVKLHTGDKKYKCCHCEAAFSRSDHLKIHKKTHDTQKPYQCSVCNRGYNTAAALTAHMQNHKAKLTAHALNQLLKDAQAPGETHALTQLLRDSSGDAHSQALNHLLKDTQKEQLLSPKGIELGVGSSPRDVTTSPVGDPSPTLSPVITVRCPICHAHCRNQAHLQRHLSRYHGEELHAVSTERPASRSGGSGASSIGGASSAASTPSPRPPSSLPSPRPLPNPLLSLVGGKLACLYCSRDGFPSLEALQLHLQSAHGSVLNGEVRDMATMLGLPSSLGTSLGASGLATSIASPLGPGSSRGVSCELCGARVGGVTALQRHVVTAHTFTDLLARAAEGVFCAQCLLPFSNPGALAEHIKLVHAAPVLSAVLNKRPPSPPTDTPTDLSKKSRHESLTSDLPASTLLCSQCNAPFTNFEAFRRHLKSHLDGGEQLSSTVAGAMQLACPECRLPLTSETALEAHLATHLSITSTEYGCQACLKLFSKPDELQKHLMDIHAHHLYRCALCKEMFDSKVSIQVHFAVKHSNECKINKCSRCSLIFRSQSEFEGHIRTSHMRRGQSGGDPISGGGSIGVSGGSYRCLLCTLTLSSEAELGAHVATHQRQFQCSLCDDAFYVEFLLDKHMQTQHNSELNGNVPQPENLAKPRRSPQKKDLRCDICDAEFSSESGLLNHRKQAHNIKSGSGGIAAKVAAASLSLFCAYCSEACKSRGDLEAHMKSHQGNGGRHKCNICDELCPSAALLAQHKLTHVKVVSGSACAVCREPLTSEQQFTNHQNEHHPSPLPQPCVVCRQTLVTDMEVTVHARFHAAQAAQAAAAASIASGIFSSGELLPPSSNSSIITTAATVSTVTTNSNSNSRSSSSPRHSPSLRCSECHLKLETIEEAEAHAAAHHQQHQQGFGRSITASSRTYQCIKCQESFASEAEIEAHVASHLLHEGSVHECHLCRATFDTPLRLQCHLIEHTFEGCGSFTCYMCSSVFTTASRLQQHMVEHGLSARPYDCHHCHQRFFFRAELENHALSHPEASDGGCRECISSFPELPRRSLRRPSLSCISSAQHGGALLTQTHGNSDAGLPRPGSPCIVCTGDETDAGPTNGHATTSTDPKDE